MIGKGFVDVVADHAVVGHGLVIGVAGLFEVGCDPIRR